jgi:hypothetical protein
MAKADANGLVAFLSPQVPSVLAQLRKAGLIVRKAKPQDAPSINEILNELEGLI